MRLTIAAVVLVGAIVSGQTPAVIKARATKAVEAHVAAATLAAGDEWKELLGLCSAPDPTPTTEPNQTSPAPLFSPPMRSEWHAEPVQVFENCTSLARRLNTPRGR